MIDAELIKFAEYHIGSELNLVCQLGGGEESVVFKLENGTDSAVLHVSPRWRNRIELEWTHSVIRRVNDSVDEAVAPIEGREGTVFEWNGQCAVIYPFVDGEALDREDPDQRAAAAGLLAGIHKSLINWNPDPRPLSRGIRPKIPADVAELKDPELDSWWYAENANGLQIGVTHGDYYRGNIICKNGSIKGIIDWHDASVRPLAVELAGAAFEFCRDDDHVPEASRVSEFVSVYLEHGGPVPEREIDMLWQFVRWWIREDARNSLAGDPTVDNAYAWKQVRAFSTLRKLCPDF